MPHDRRLQPSGVTRVVKRGVVRCLQHHRCHNRMPELGSGLAARRKLLPRDDHRVLLGLPGLLGPTGPAVGRVVLDPVWLAARVQRRQVPQSGRCRWVPTEYAMLSEGPEGGARSRRPSAVWCWSGAGEGARPQARIIRWINSSMADHSASGNEKALRYHDETVWPRGSAKVRWAPD